jgi:GT2 family glycosyltransferase
VGNSERRAFDAYRAFHPVAKQASLQFIVVGQEQAGLISAAHVPTHPLGRVRTVGEATMATSEEPAALPKPIGAALDEIASKSDWILPLLQGDYLSEQTADIVQRAIQDAPDASLIYWDEDVIEKGQRADPWVKPGWDELLFNWLGGLAGASLISVAAAREAAKGLPELRFDREGLQCLLLAIARSAPHRVAHIPLILTHRCERTRLPRTFESSLAGEEQLNEAPAPPKVSIIVPTRDRADLLAACLKGIRATNFGGQLELIIVDNGTVEAEALRIVQEQEALGAKVLRDDGPFNFSRLNNAAAEIATGEFLCFFNNDVEPLDPEWLNLMMKYAVDERTGAVGALLLYPSGRVQHAGVVVGMGGAAGHVQKGVRPDEPRHRTWHSVTREVSAVTAAVMVVRKSSFDAVGRFDEIAFPVAFNDVDLCLRLKKSGLRNIFVAEARLLHRESESRGEDRRPERAAKFAAELRALQQRWGTETFEDPHFSALFLRSTERCVLVP